MLKKYMHRFRIHVYMYLRECETDKQNVIFVKVVSLIEDIHALIHVKEINALN